MISGSALYDGMNIFIALVALLSIFIVPKALADSRSRRRFIAACIFLILAGIIFSVSLRVFRLAPLAYAGEGLGKAKEGTYLLVDSFKLVALAGNALELLALAFLASVSRALVGGRAKSLSEREES